MDSSSDRAKKLAAIAAVNELPPSGVLGLGTGSTTRFFVEAVGELVRQGRAFECVCTSEATRAQAMAAGIPLLPDEGPWAIDVTIDGADEVDASLDLSKGGGGALTREKIVSFASRRTVIVCDGSKRVPKLGTTRPISLELVPFGHASTLTHLGRFGRPTLRPARSDGGNLLADLEVAPIDDPGALDRALRSIPGVIETGLFVARADVILVGYPDHVERLTR